MKKILIISCLLLVTFSTYAQTITEKDIIGVWKVKTVKYLLKDIPKDRMQLAEKLRKEMEKSSYKFNKDHTFYFDCTIPEMSIFNKAHWKLGSKSNAIHIQEWKDKDKAKPLLNNLIIKTEEGKVFFIEADGALLVEVEKVE